MKKILQILVGCAVSGLMLYVVFKGMNVGELEASLVQVHWWPVIPFVALFFVHHILRAMRWRLLLPDLDGPRPRLRQLFDSTVLGSLASFLLPLRIGEFVRPFLLSRWSEYSFATCFVSVVIERFFDLSAVLVTFAVIAPGLASLPPWASNGAAALGLLAGCILFFILGGVLIPGPVRRLVDTCVRPLPSKLAAIVHRFSNDLLTGAAVIHTPMRLLGVLVFTAGVWAATYLQFYALLFMFPYEKSIVLSFALGVFVALAVAVPSAPGFFGVFHVGCVAALALFAYPPTASQAYAIITHALTYLVYVVVGFALMLVHGLTLSDLKGAPRSIEGSEAKSA
jgi:hypothetical protein